MLRQITVVGISDSRQQWFPPEVEAMIREARVVSGGKRHHAIMSGYLRPDVLWIDVVVPLSAVFNRYSEFEHVLVFASGDPWFYGLAVTLQREMPWVELQVVPSFHSLQLLAHAMQLPYPDMRVVSLTGRPWPSFDAALIRGESLIGVLTDHHHTPSVIARRMYDYGYTNYEVTVGECLGHERRQRVRTFDVEQLAASQEEFRFPNNLMLRQTQPRPHPFGIPEQNFMLLDGRENMITKAPIRLATLSALGLSGKQVMWDVGFCTGSVSIEAKMQFPDLSIVAFEVRPQCEDIISTNMKRFGTPGIDVRMGDFMDVDLSALSRPDAVFIGGHGGRLSDMVERVSGVLQPGGCIVTNAVTSTTVELFEKAAERVGKRVSLSMLISLDDHNPIRIMRME